MPLLRYVVSACLAGVKCRYDGEDKKDQAIFQMVKEGKALPLCPEQLGGLPTPRKPSKLVLESGKRKVVSISGENLSQFFLKGAKLSFRVAKKFKINSAYLKKRSPACGFEPGELKGITSNFLKQKGIRVLSR